MKAIAIIELPDDGFEKGKWYIDGYIRYTENESLMKKFDADMIPLKPIPNKACEILAEGLDAMEKMKSVEVRVVRRTE